MTAEKKNRIRRRTALLCAAAALLLVRWSGPAAAAAETGETAREEPAEQAPEKGLPLWLLEDTAEPGTMETLVYPSRAYGGGREGEAGVYLPFGYDPDGRYDVVFLWPGSCGDAEEAMEAEYQCYMEDRCQCDLTLIHVLDRMIETGLTRPVLVVCLQDFGHVKLFSAQTDMETIWSLVTERYATWADGSVPPEEARRHFAFVGFSQGAIYTQTVAIARFFDRIANFGAVSYGSRSSTAAKEILESPYPLGMLYYMTGNKEDIGAAHARDAYRSILWRCPEKVKEGENAQFRRCWNLKHSYALVHVEFVGLLPAVFPPEADA